MGSPSSFFTPRSFSGDRAISGYSIISGNYFKVANDLRAMTRTGHEGRPGHYYVFPSVAMYVASFEAFIQEHLAFSRRSLTDSRKPEAALEIDLLDALKDQSGRYREFKAWVKEVYRLYDRAGVGIDVNGVEYQNLLAVKELRNTVVHYNPHFIEVASWPARLEQALAQTKVKVLNAGWVTNFSRAEISDWAHDSVKASVQLFSHLSGAEDPFTVVLETNGMPPWE